MYATESLANGVSSIPDLRLFTGKTPTPIKSLSFLMSLSITAITSISSSGTVNRNSAVSFQHGLKPITNRIICHVKRSSVIVLKFFSDTVVFYVLGFKFILIGRMTHDLYRNVWIDNFFFSFGKILPGYDLKAENPTAHPTKYKKRRLLETEVS